MKRVKRGVALVLLVSGVLWLALVAPAAAHESRAEGGYEFEVGWSTEPAYAGQMNGVQLVLTDLATGKPVLNADKALRVEVQYGSQSIRLALSPTFDPDSASGTPGEYTATLFPTAVGDYTFHFTGRIGTQKIDQSFTSSPTTFDPVEDPATVQFPAKAPSTTDVALRMDTQLDRLATSSDVSRAQTLGIVAIAVGIAGLGVALIALLRRTR